MVTSFMAEDVSVCYVFLHKCLCHPRLNVFIQCKPLSVVTVEFLFNSCCPPQMLSICKTVDTFLPIMHLSP